MIAADTSALMHDFQGVNNATSEKIDEALAYYALTLPPVVLTEIASDPFLPKKFMEKISELP